MADSSAAGGQKLASADRGWPSRDTALAAPADWFEFTFNADASTPYHVWVRLRATGNTKLNDSLFAQFSDAVTATGTPLFRMGTTSALTLNLQTSNGAKLNGWGWVDGAYWLSQLSTVSFSASGAHTLRLQTREDGVQLDQVVLSRATYLTVAPGQRSGDSTIIAKPAVPQAPVATPYSGVAAMLPGVVQAEDFDNGGEGVAHHDADATNAGGAYRTGGIDLESASEGGYDVGWVTAGEWLGYSVKVQTAGSYLFEARVAAPSQGGTFHVEAGGVNVTGSLSIPSTGSWQTWTTIAKTMTLAAGPQQFRVVFDAPGPAAFGNFNWFRVSAVTSTPYSGTAVALPGTLALEAFDLGGEGLAYHDTTAGNSGAGRIADVDLEASTLGTTDIGWIATSEWVRYSVNVAAAGPYVLTAKVSSPTSTGRLHVTVGDVSTAVTAVPLTGGWQTWQEVSWTATLAAGPQALTLVFDAGGFNLGSLAVATSIPPSVEPPPPLPPPLLPTPDPPVGGTVISVPLGGDLQAAIDAAVAGDTILRQAGATYAGNFTLPAK
ncbi:MAG: carbohydrate-binding protein, partial [Vicinamibacterales bacterium]